MYYETIKVLDCTIRDGGLVNKHDFSLEFVRRLYTLLTAAGVDYMEMVTRTLRNSSTRRNTVRGSSAMTISSGKSRTASIPR